MMRIVLLILLSTILALQCQSSIMVSNYVEIQKGLKPEHKAETPLIEMEYHQPDSESARIQRIYEDGSLYFFVNEVDEMAWVYITKVKEGGMEDLRFISSTYCRSYDSNPKQNIGQGLFIYRLADKKMRKEIAVRGVNYGKYPKLQEIDTIINSNLEPIKQID